MTLKTSLIITGDSASAQAAVDDLRKSVDNLSTQSRSAATAQGAISTSSNAVVVSARGASVAQGAVAAANTTVATTSRLAAAGQGALAVASEVATGAMASFGVSALTVEAILTGGLSLALTAAIGFMTGFADEAFKGSGALGEQEDAAASLSEQIDSLNAALKRETQSQYLAHAATLQHAESQRALAIEAVKTRKALLEGAIAAEKSTPDWTVAGSGQGIVQAASMAAQSRVRELERELAGANANLKKANENVRLERAYYVDRGIAAATDPRARAELTYDQKLARLDTRRSQISEREYAREKIKLEREKAAAIDAASDAEGRAAKSSGRLSSARSSATAADRAAADAQKKLDADLKGAIARYDPAAKAASDYADELERIARLAKAGKIDATQAQDFRAQASANYLGQAIGIGDLKKAAGVEQDDIDKVNKARGAIDGIVQSIQDETAALGNLDPVQRELLRHRKALADLAPEERAAAEDRIRNATIERVATDNVKRATEDARRAKEQLAASAVDAFTAIVVGGQKAGDVVKQLAGSIASAAIEATLFNTGPMAAILKGAAVPGGGTAAGSIKGLADAGADPIGRSLGREMDKVFDKVFGNQGSFGKTLRNVGLGVAAGGIAGSKTGGAVGGAIGGYAGEQLLTGMLGKLGGFAGPIGSIAGGLIGGVVGGLLKKTKTGSANITSVDGQATLSGNSSSFKQAASGAAGSVQDGLAQIAQQLGGSIGAFNVSIGQRHGDWRVRTGTGSLKVAKGAKEFDDDQQGAIAYAIQLAVSQGAINGLSTAVQQAIKSSPDIDKALAEALKVQQVETLLGGIGSEMASQFKSLETQAKERVRIARQYGFDVVAIEKKNAEDRTKLVDQILGERIGSLQSLLDDMKFGNLAEGSAVDQRTALLAQIAKARSDAEAGVDGAADKLAALSRNLIDLSRDSFGTAGNEYAADRATAAQAAEAVIKAENDRVRSAAGEQVATAAKLDQTNATLDELADQQSQTNSTLTDILAALTRTGVSVGGGSSMIKDLYRRQEL